MAFLSSMRVKKIGHAKILWMPADWGVQKGDTLCLETVLHGQTYYHTTTARANGSRYIILPKWWDVEIGDVIDIKITYANVPKREPIGERHDNPGSEDQEGTESLD